VQSRFLTPVWMLSQPHAEVAQEIGKNLKNDYLKVGDGLLV
jgi:hypothetical protein